MYCALGFATYILIRLDVQYLACVYTRLVDSITGFVMCLCIAGQNIWWGLRYSTVLYSRKEFRQVWHLLLLISKILYDPNT